MTTQPVKIPELDDITLASGDLLPVVDISDSNIVKKSTLSDLGDFIDTAYDLTNLFNKTSDNLDDISAGTTNKHLTTTLETKLNDIEALADVTDATNVNAAGATMNTDTDVSGNSWVVDEDNMVSDSSTKVPTQQSVKAYVDGLVSTPGYAFGNFIWNSGSGTSGAGTQTISGLGFNPSRIKITAKLQSGTNSVSTSTGIYDGTSYSTIYANGVYNSQISTSKILIIYEIGDDGWEATATLGTGSFDIIFTYVAAVTNNMVILWEAYE